VFQVDIYRYNSETDTEPRMETHEVDEGFRQRMELDVVAGACSVQKANYGSRPARIGQKSANRLVIPPLTAMPVIRDLVVDQTHFFDQYRHIKPWLINDSPPPAGERLQFPWF